MRSLSLISLSFLIISSSFAQKQNIYYLKNNGRYVNQRDSADFIRTVSEPDSGSTLYNVLEFYTNGNKKLIGKSAFINPLMYDGQCITFYKNGSKAAVTNYKKGLKTGDESIYYPNGKPYLNITYPDRDTANNNLGLDCLLITANYDTLGKALVNNGNGYYKGYDDDFKYVEEEGPVKNQKREGTWKGVSEKLKLTFIETYNNGALISGTATTGDGNNTNYTGSRYHLPRFKGGLKEFGKYLSNNIVYPFSARQKGIQGKVVLTFMIEKDGTLTDIKIKKSVDPALDQESVRVIKNSPQWLAGTEFGKPVRVSYSVPINFSLTPGNH